MHSTTPLTELPTTSCMRVQTAGSADAFKRVDLDYVSAAAEAAKKAGAKYFGLVSSQGGLAGWMVGWMVGRSVG